MQEGKAEKKVNSIDTPLDLLHMDLFGPIYRKSIDGDMYGLVVTDDYSRFSWVMFLKAKSETYECLKLLIKKARVFVQVKGAED